MVTAAMPIRRLLASIAFAVAFAPSLAPAQLGGPDVYGYRAVDVDYDFVPLSTGVGTLIVPPSSGDPEIALPWNFNWYGVDYPSVFVGSKGTLGFTDWYLGTNSYCPAAPNTQPDLMPLTQDPAAQLGDPGNEVWAWIDFAGDRVILSWEDVWAYIWSDPDYGPFDFQVHLYASGDIEFHYSSVFVNWAPGDLLCIGMFWFQY